MQLPNESCRLSNLSNAIASFRTAHFLTVRSFSRELCNIRSVKFLFIVQHMLIYSNSLTNTFEPLTNVSDSFRFVLVGNFRCKRSQVRLFLRRRSVQLKLDCRIKFPAENFSKTKKEETARKGSAINQHTNIISAAAEIIIKALKPLAMEVRKFMLARNEITNLALIK